MAERSSFAFWEVSIILLVYLERREGGGGSILDIKRELEEKGKGRREGQLDREMGLSKIETLSRLLILQASPCDNYQK